MQVTGSEFTGGGDWLAVIAGILLIAAALMTSIRALRLFALIAGLAGFVYFAIQPVNQLGLIIAGLFVMTNGAQLAILMRRGRTGTTLSQEKLLFSEVLGVSGDKNETRLRDLLRWREIRAGTVLMDQGQADPPLIYIAEGNAKVERDGKVVGNCAPGDFIGEMSLVSGERASATATATETMRVAEFDRDALGHFVRDLPEVGGAISNAFNRGLAAKVSRMNEAAVTSDESAHEVR